MLGTERLQVLAETMPHERILLGQLLHWNATSVRRESIGQILKT